MGSKIVHIELFPVEEIQKIVDSQGQFKVHHPS